MCYNLTLGGIFIFLLLHSSEGSSIPQEFQSKFNCEKGKKCDSVLFYGKLMITYHDLSKGSEVSVLAEESTESLIQHKEKGTYHVVKSKFIRKTGSPQSNTLHDGVHPTPSKTDANHKFPSSFVEPSKPPEELQSPTDNSGPGLEDEGEYVSIENEEIISDTFTGVYSTEPVQTISPDASVPTSKHLKSTTIKATKQSVLLNQNTDLSKVDEQLSVDHTVSINNSEGTHLGTEIQSNFLKQNTDLYNVDEQISVDRNSEETHLGTETRRNILNNASITDTPKSSSTVNFSKSLTAADTFFFKFVSHKSSTTFSQADSATSISPTDTTANTSQSNPAAIVAQSNSVSDTSSTNNYQVDTTANVLKSPFSKNSSQPDTAQNNSQADSTTSISPTDNFPNTSHNVSNSAHNVSNSVKKLAPSNASQSGFTHIPQKVSNNPSFATSVLREIQRYGADQPTTDKKLNVKHEVDNTPEKLNSINIISRLNKADVGEKKDNIPVMNTKEICQDKPRVKPANHIQRIKPVNVDSSAEHFIHETENSFFLKMLENLKSVLNSVSEQITSGPFSDYASFIILLNTVLFIIFLLLLNCFNICKCNNVMKGKLYMCEKKLLEHNVEKVSIQKLVDEKNKALLLFDKLKEEEMSTKNHVDLLTSKIDELKEHEKHLTESLNEYKSKYQSLEEMSNKKNIKKNYEKLMDQVKVQKDKLDELAAGMEERAEILRKEKENVESLLSLQAEEHGKIINDYRMLLNNVELENNELRDIVKTMSVDSDVGEKLLQAVKLQVRLSDLEKENNNLNHQLEGEREAHKLLEDHQRITQKEVNDLRESYETILKEKSDISNKLKYITDYFQQLEDKLKKEISDKDELINEKLGDDDSLAKALMNLRKENCVLNEENSILRAKYDSLKVELTDQKNEEKLSKTKLESEREQIWMDWRAAERKIESLNLDNKVLRSKLVAMGSKSESSFREIHTQTYDDPDKMLSPTSSLFLDHTSPVPQPAFFIPSYAIPPPPLSDEEMRQLYGPSSNYNQNGYHSDEDQEHSYDHRLPPLGGTFSPPTLDNIPVPNIPPPLDNEQLWRRQTWNSQDISSNEEEESTQHNSYSRRRTGDSVSSVSSSKQSFV